MSRLPLSNTATRPSSTPRSFAGAFVGALVALVVAAGINGAIALAAGDVLVIPGELGVGQIVTYTLAMILPAAATLWALPRYFPWITVAVAVLTIPFPFAEFGSPVAVWLSVMHVVAGVSAALIAPRVLAQLSSRQLAARASS